jgi:hypothetical protein
MRRLLVTDVNAEFQKLKAMHLAAVLVREDGVPVALLPAFPFRAAGRNEVMDLLLYPAQHGSYATRLFFERQIAGRGANWGQHRLVERNWWSPSWKDVLAHLPWTAMLCAHLRAVA